MRDTITNIICEILNIEEKDLNGNFDNKEIWDSLHRIEIIFAVEDEFDISFTQSELAEMNTPNKLIIEAEKKVKE